MRQTIYEYDAFISHAVEDKIPIANDLCAKLERAGLKIWYSGKELGIGDSIEKTIERGLNRSRYGIVILSPTYLAKNWTIREFYTLLAKEIEEHKVILPVLYNVGVDELKKKDLLMADRFAVNADRGLDFVVDKLVGEIRKPKAVKRRMAWFSKVWMVLILSLLANIIFLLRSNLFPPATPGLLSGGDREQETVHAFTGENLFSEMQRMASQLTMCTCNAPKATQGQAIIRQANFDTGLSQFVLDGYAEEIPRIQPRPGSKMTMAVVFQFQTAPDSGSRPDRVVDDMVETINSRTAGASLISMSGQAAPSARLETVCSHGITSQTSGSLYRESQHRSSETFSGRSETK